MSQFQLCTLKMGKVSFKVTKNCQGNFKECVEEGN